MIRKAYQLREDPFGVTPDPSFLFLSHSHREALATLVHGVEAQRGFMSLIADPGLGKTTLLFLLMEYYRRRLRTAFVFQTSCTSQQLLSCIFTDLTGRKTTPDRIYEEINEALSRFGADKPCLLVIDEAQNLADDVLESVRLLSNFETPKRKLLQIILAGQKQLAEKLAHDNLWQLRQRISLTCTLRPMREDEVAVYVRHRLAVAGYAGPPLFSEGALRRIAVSSGGVPRRINQYCYHSMLLAHTLGRQQIDLDLVEEVEHDLELQVGKAEPEEDSTHTVPGGTAATGSESRPAPTANNSNSHPSQLPPPGPQRRIAHAVMLASLVVLGFWAQPAHDRPLGREPGHPPRQHPPSIATRDGLHVGNLSFPSFSRVIFGLAELASVPRITSIAEAKAEAERRPALATSETNDSDHHRITDHTSSGSGNMPHPSVASVNESGQAQAPLVLLARPESSSPAHDVSFDAGDEHVFPCPAWWLRTVGTCDSYLEYRLLPQAAVLQEQNAGSMAALNE
jgi:general secretion pathway protein A